MKYSFVLSCFILLAITACTPKEPQLNDQFQYAQTRTDDLRLSIYLTAHAIEGLLKDEAGKREALSIFRCNGITKAYLEVYRSGLVVEEDLLCETRDFFQENGIQVVGGIATVPGKDFGVRQEGALGWFNWQHPKTQEDLREVMRMSARVFDEFVVDDFLCTGDTSAISKEAKGDRSWSQYRMDLLTELSTEIFIKPAKEVNPNISMIIKYPQWYDRFHLFGYDVAREPALYDKVWIGTESRGQYTQRFGFVQPYEGFISYRWMDDIAGEKMAGAWFDHGDCDKNDFIEQAWQTVLAGTKEIVFFNYYSFVNGHPAHQLVRREYGQLADLAAYVQQNPVTGIHAYKPPASDAGGDLYLMDYISMLGIPLVPVHEFPTNAKVILLPTQAAKDKEIYTKIENALQQGTCFLFTAGFIANAVDGDQIAKIAGVDYPIQIQPGKADKVFITQGAKVVEHGLDYECDMKVIDGEIVLKAIEKEKEIPIFVQSKSHEGRVFTLNTHTFSQKDFDAVGEVLLCPKPLGLLEIPDEWANILRKDINQILGLKLNGPTRICVQPMGSSSWFIHNYNKLEKEFEFRVDGSEKGNFVNGFTGEPIEAEDNLLKLKLPGRSRIWIKSI